MSHPETGRVYSKDEINGMLDEEFHTKNDIPTDPHSHSLFFVPRTQAVLAWVAGMVGGCMFMAGAFTSHKWLGILGAIVAWGVPFWAFK